MKIDEIIVGTPIVYWAIIKEDGRKFAPFESIIISKPWKLPSGEIVCNIANKSGCVAISHLTK